MKASQSLQKTLGIGLTLGVTFLWILALTGTVYVSQNKLNQLFDSALAETMMPHRLKEIIRAQREQLQNDLETTEVLEDYR